MYDVGVAIVGIRPPSVTFGVELGVSGSMSCSGKAKVSYGAAREFRANRVLFWLRDAQSVSWDTQKMFCVIFSTLRSLLVVLQRKVVRNVTNINLSRGWFTVASC